MGIAAGALPDTLWLTPPGCFLRNSQAQDHGNVDTATLFCLGWKIKDHLVPTSLPLADIFSTKPDCSKFHPT